MNKIFERIAVFEFENNRLDKEIAKTLTDRLRDCSYLMKSKLLIP